MYHFKKCLYILLGVILLLLVPACGTADPEENCPFLDSHPDTVLSDDVLLTTQAYGTDMDSFFLQMDFRNLSQTTYNLEKHFFFEKEVDGKWQSMPRRTSLNGIDIGTDSVPYTITPSGFYSIDCFPFFSTTEVLEPGTRYRVLTRLYADEAGPNKGPSSYILVMSEFTYPAYALYWTNTLFPHGEDYLPMTVTPEWPDSIGNHIFHIDYSLPETDSRPYILDKRLYIERLEKGLYWKTAPLFQNRSPITWATSDSFYSPSTYALKPGVPYRLILQVDYRLGDGEGPVLTSSFCGPFTIPDESASGGS